MTTFEFPRKPLKTYISTVYPYPPPIFVKHHAWYFFDADFFIIIKGVIFGLHRTFFNSSPFFLDILAMDDPDCGPPLGTMFHFPIPFDELSPAQFTTFLFYLYYPDNFCGTDSDLRDIRQMGLNWKLPRIAAAALVEIMERRKQLLPLVARQMLDLLPAYRWRNEYERRNRIYELSNENCEEEDDDRTEVDSSDDESI